jgi:hypothetical protein
MTDTDKNKDMAISEILHDAAMNICDIKDWQLAAHVELLAARTCPRGVINRSIYFRSAASLFLQHGTEAGSMQSLEMARDTADEGAVGVHPEIEAELTDVFNKATEALKDTSPRGDLESDLAFLKGDVIALRMEMTEVSRWLRKLIAGQAKPAPTLTLTDWSDTNIHGAPLTERCVCNEFETCPVCLKR